ncbi:helix-turn-helix transcriptional regulator [Acidiphilium sp.]|uniref:helix-turn-helix domain-containing protein n=1 Tax=Acidiphilium TaxID=522 RepID=UPI00338ECA73
MRSLRDVSGLSQRQLASMSGVSRNALRRLESKEIPGAVDVIENIFVHVRVALWTIRDAARWTEF